MSYQAIVCKIHTRPHPNADRLLIGSILAGETVVVGMETQDGELGIYFPSDGQLSEQYARANDLVRRKDPVTGKAAGGFLEENRRVRNLSLRGVRTDGLWMPISSLSTLSHKKYNLMEGDCLDQIDAVPLCNKYETPATQRVRNQGQKQANKKKEHIVAKFFPEQNPISQLRHVLHSVSPYSLLYFTEKLHGMNGRVGFVKKKETWFARFCRKLGFPLKDQYALTAGSHHVNRGIVEDSSGKYVANIWTRVARNHFVDKLRKGECIYFEIVGFDGEKFIMSPQSIGDKEVQEQYGTTMQFRYGCQPGEYKIYIYRIRQANEDGHFTELSWNQVKQRCGELGLPYIPEVDMMPFLLQVDEIMKTSIADYADEIAQGPSLLDESHIREGVVLRVENASGTQFMKHKSWLFKNLEGSGKDNPDAVDMEEAS